MGVLVSGQWQDRWYDTDGTQGRFIRPTSQFRNWVTPDGGPGPTCKGGFKAEAGRYHLYVSLACPWSHRCTLSFSVRSRDLPTSSRCPLSIGERAPRVGSSRTAPASYPILSLAHALFTKSTGRRRMATQRQVTVPVLLDKQTKEIVSNESSEIIRMMNSAFDRAGGAKAATIIQRFCERRSIRSTLTSTRTSTTGFTEPASRPRRPLTKRRSFRFLKPLTSSEKALGSPEIFVRCANNRSGLEVVSDVGTVRLRLWRTFQVQLAKAVRVPQSFCLHERSLSSGPTKKRSTVDFAHIKRHYYESHAAINPSRVVPLGPPIDFERPHGRDRRFVAFD